MTSIVGWEVGLGLAALVLWATVALAGGRGRVKARRKGGGLQMIAALMFGFGAVLDPPQRHVAEAKDETPKGTPESGDPELDD